MLAALILSFNLLTVAATEPAPQPRPPQTQAPKLTPAQREEIARVIARNLTMIDTVTRTKDTHANP